MALYDRQLTRIASTSQTTVLSAPAGGVFRGLLCLCVTNPAGNSTLTATIDLHDGTNDHPVKVASLAAGDSLLIDHRLILKSTDSLKITLSASPTSPVPVIATYNDQ